MMTWEPMETLTTVCMTVMVFQPLNGLTLKGKLALLKPRKVSQEKVTLILFVFYTHKYHLVRIINMSGFINYYKILIKWYF